MNTREKFRSGPPVKSHGWGIRFLGDAHREWGGTNLAPRGTGGEASLRSAGPPRVAVPTWFGIAPGERPPGRRRYADQSLFNHFRTRPPCSGAFYRLRSILWATRHPPAAGCHLSFLFLPED